MAWIRNRVTNFSIAEPEWGWVGQPVTTISQSNRKHETLRHMFIIGLVLMVGPIKVLNTLRPRQDDRLFPDISKCIFLNENLLILIKISLKFVPKGPINNIPALIQIMAWRRTGDKPLSEPKMVSLLTHICVTRPQWANRNNGIK